MERPNVILFLTDQQRADSMAAHGNPLDLTPNLDRMVFTSDHGSHFKTRNSEYKRSCRESSIRVPGVIMGPGFHGSR